MADNKPGSPPSSAGRSAPPSPPSNGGGNNPPEPPSQPTADPEKATRGYDHAPAPQMAPRPSAGMSLGADSQAFAERQAKVASAEPASRSLTVAERREQRVEQFKTLVRQSKEHTFNGDRSAERDKGALSKHHKQTLDKGGIDR